MPKTNNLSSELDNCSDLHRRAEEALRKKEQRSPASDAEQRQLLHELQVHQIELEMLNEELTKARNDAEKAMQMFSDLYEHAPVGYFCLNRKGAITRVNAVGAAMLGAPQKRLIGRRFGLFVEPKERSKFADFHSQVFEDKGLSACEAHLFRENGESIVVECTAGICSDGDNFLMVMIDITERRKIEELREHIESIIQHDLRAPACTAIMASRGLSEAANLTDEQRQILRLLGGAGQSMLDTLNRSLLLYKIESGKYNGASELFDCLNVLREVLESLQILHKHLKHGTVLLINGHNSQIADKFLCHIQPDLFRAAMHNLIQNALEATPEGVAVVIDMVSYPEPRIEIRNRGVVPTEIRDNFFDKFVTKGKTKGTGIGTYSAKVMVEALGGSIEMRTSDEKNETVVTVRLPA